MTTTTKSSMTVSRGNGNGHKTAMSERAMTTLTSEDVRNNLETRLDAALREAAMRPKKQVAEPEGWWDIVAYGPIQPGAGSIPFVDAPLLPHQVIRVGEPAFVAALIILNPFGPLTPSASDVLSNFALPYSVEYSINNVRTFTHVGVFTNSDSLVPGVSYYVDILELDTSTPGLYELNVSARITGCNGTLAPPFSGFARAVVDIDPDLFFPAPGLQFDEPIRYQIYE